MKSNRSFLSLAMLFAGFFVCFLFNLGVSPALAADAVWHNGESIIATSTTWRSGEIHAISDGGILWIKPGATLTIEPSVVVKIGFNALIRVNGNLIANGSADNLIYFVSLRDDTIAGDTNGDGSATIANLDDWRVIDIDGGRFNSIVNADINYAVVKHGGRGYSWGVIFNVSKAASFKVNNSNIVDNKGIIFIDSVSNNVAITNSNLYNPSFCDYASSTDPCHLDSGLTSFSSKTIDLSNNYWGSAGGPTYTTGADPEIFTGVVLANLVRANMLYQPPAVKPFEFGIKRLNPVIVIPGIMGSWQDWTGKWQIDPILHTYDDLLDAMRAAGYKDGETLFAFPYQWRQSNVISAQELKTKIDEVKAVCKGEKIDCSKVDLVAHSMGGLVARAYIEGDNYQKDVDQLIFIATPHKGAPKAYLMWEGGELNPNNWIYNIVMKKVFEVEADVHGYDTSILTDGVYQYVINSVPSVKQLLPIYDYLRDSNSNLFRQYPNSYPVNNFLDSLNNPINLNKLKDVSLMNIIGDAGNSTISGLRLVPSGFNLDGKWQDGIPENYNSLFGDRGLEYDSGDETVPKFSNSGFNGLDDVIISNSDHSSVVTKSQKTVIKALTGKEPDLEVSRSLIDKILMFRIFSPADFEVMAPDGKLIGRNIEGLGALNEVKDAFYSGYNNSLIPEFIIIPNPLPGNYQIKLIGTDAGGEYTISASILSESTSSDSDFSGQILPNNKRSLNFSYLDSGEFLSEIRSDITIESAIKDVEDVYGRGLLSGKNNKQKIIQQYDLLKLKIRVADQLLDLAVKGIDKITVNRGLKSEIKNKLIELANKEIEKLKQKRLQMIADSFRDIDKIIVRFVDGGLLKQLGYDIIKANNDYLINNL